MASPVCSQNASAAFNYLTGKGLSSVQAAGVVGNLQFESHLDPKSDVPDPTRTDPSARGKGIASWGPPRWRSLLAFAAGRDPSALDTQLDFLWAELQSGGYGLQQLLATTTPEDATITFQNLFENPDRARAHTDVRIKLANDALDCLTVRPPIAPRGGTVIATAGVVALVAAVGYGVYKVLEARVPSPEIGPEPPPVFRPTYRPGL